MQNALNRDVLFEFRLKFWNTANMGVPARSLQQGRQTGLSAQQKGTTARWYSNKTSLHILELTEERLFYATCFD